MEVDNSPVKHFLLKFAVSGTTGRIIQNAKLRLYNVNSSSKGGDFRRVLDNTWNESSVTYNTAPAYNSSVLVSLGSVRINKWYEVDLTQYITGDGVYSLRVTSTSNDGADYTSKEGSFGFKPQLVITLSQ